MDNETFEKMISYAVAKKEDEHQKEEAEKNRLEKEAVRKWRETQMKSFADREKRRQEERKKLRSELSKQALMADQLERILDSLYPKALDDGELLALAAEIGGDNAGDLGTPLKLTEADPSKARKQGANFRSRKDPPEDEERKSRYFHYSGFQAKPSSHVDLSQPQLSGPRQNRSGPDGRGNKAKKQFQGVLTELSKIPDELRVSIGEWLGSENQQEQATFAWALDSIKVVVDTTKRGFLGLRKTEEIRGVCAQIVRRKTPPRHVLSPNGLKLLPDSNGTTAANVQKDTQDLRTLLDEKVKPNLVLGGYSEASAEQIIRGLLDKDRTVRNLLDKTDQNAMAIDLSRPTWIKVRRKYLAPETLEAYNLPWDIYEVSETTTSLAH